MAVIPVEVVVLAALACLVLTPALVETVAMATSESLLSSEVDMPKQFLLNPDGSVPANANIELLTAAGIPLVMPTPMPREGGMVAVEQDPQQDAGGVWRQVWVLEPAPEPEETE